MLTEMNSDHPLWETLKECAGSFEETHTNIRNSNSRYASIVFEVRPEAEYWDEKKEDFCLVPTPLVGFWSENDVIVDTCASVTWDDLSNLNKVKKVPVTTYTYERIESE